VAASAAAVADTKLPAVALEEPACKPAADSVGEPAAVTVVVEERAVAEVATVVGQAVLPAGADLPTAYRTCHRRQRHPPRYCHN
jgi:hypothetical protein